MCAYNIYIIYSDIVWRGGISLISWTKNRKKKKNTHRAHSTHKILAATTITPSYNNNHGHKITIGEVGGIFELELEHQPKKMNVINKYQKKVRL